MCVSAARVVVILAAIISSFAIARADEFPSRPSKMVVTVSAGGAADSLARLLGSKLAAKWDQPVVIENRLGATGMIGAESVAKSLPDGYTSLFVSTSFVQAPVLFPNAPYDIDRDFAPVSQIAGLAVVFVVGANSPYKTLKEYLDAARQDGKSLTYGSIGIGSSMHVYGETLAKDAHVKLVHVPYRGEAPTITDTMAGHLDATFISVASGLPLIRSGKLRSLAVIGKVRSEQLPDTPSFVELGFPRLDLLGWYGVVVPGATPKPIIDKMSRDLDIALHEPDVSSIIRDGGNVPVGGSPQMFGTLLKNDSRKWRQLMQEADIKAVP
jgi:tripartite-type tricarboxylate transporter receptor subunit TctC